MENYFEVAVQLDKTQGDGAVKKVTEKYLVEAFSFGDAENRILEKVAAYSSGELFVKAVKRAKLTEIFTSKSEVADRWYKCKLNFITIDEKTGEEKKSSATIYVQAKDFDDARNTLQEGMKGSMVDYEKSLVQETQILDVFPLNK